MEVSGRAAGLILGAVIVVMAGAMILTGSQTSRILSNVGNSIPTDPQDPGAGAAGQPDTGAGGEQPGATSEPLAALRDDARIVYTGTLQLVVADVDGAIGEAEGIVGRAGGYLGGSERTSAGGSPTASMTYRIPAERWADTLGRLRDLGESVVAERTGAVEVTGELVDLEARLRNLRATEAAVQALAAQATTIRDVLTVQEELTAVRGEIERLDGQRAALADRAALGTLTVVFGVETVAVVEAARGWDAASEVDEATATLVSRLQRVASGAIWFGIAWLPFLLPIVLLGVGGVLLLRRSGLLGWLAARRREDAFGA